MKSDLDKITTEKPYSSVSLRKDPIAVPDIKKLHKDLAEMYNFFDNEAEKCYKKGTVVRLTPDTPSTMILNNIIGLYLDKVREKLHDVESEEHRKSLQVEINKIQKAFSALVDILGTDNFLLDVNSVLHIIHGYTNINVQPIFEYYETRRRTTHRHDDSGTP